MSGPPGVVAQPEAVDLEPFLVDPKLAAAGIFPALDSGVTRSGEESELRSEEELAAARTLRRRLTELEGSEASRELADLIEGSADNEELLGKL